jgi:hypothetical protein
MDRRASLSDISTPAGHRCVAVFRLADGTICNVEMSKGCERFIGRFTRLPALRHADHVIRFHDWAFAATKNR